MILIDNSWSLLWACFNRACLIQPLDSELHTLQWESLRSSAIDLKEHFIDLNKSGKSPGAISKQLQVPGSAVELFVSKVHGTVVSLPQ